MFAPPTDNLYKFLSIFGMVIILASVGGAYQSQQEWLASIREARFVRAKVAEAYLLVNRDRMALWRQIDEASKKGEGKRAEELRAELDKLDARDVPIDRSPELKKQDELSQALYEHTQFMLIIAGIGFAAGVLMTAVGFQLWYSRVQVHLDRKLAAGTTTPVSTGEGGDDQSAPE